MKKLILSAVLVSLFAFAQAQEGKQPGQRGKMKHHKGMMMQKLNLSEAQKTQMKAIHEDFRKQMDELKKSESTLTVTEWKKRKETIRSAHKARMQSVLTAEQKAQVEKMKAEGKSRHEAGSKMKMEKMKSHLGLTDDQVARLTKHREDMAQKIKSIRENKSLDDVQKKEQIKQLMKDNKDSMKSIFTEEQLKKMKEGRKDQHDKKKETI